MISPSGAWQHYAEKAQPRRQVNAAGATTWFNWTQYPDHGPDESVLGDLRGRHVLELGSGSGANIAHLASLRACCVGVDVAPARTVAARRSWGHLPNLKFVTHDAIDYLTTATETFDIVYSVFGAVWFIDPGLLLPLIRARMTLNGILAFSHLPPGAEPAARTDRLITKREYSANQWMQILTAAGFRSVTTEIIAAPTAGQPGTLLARALAAPAPERAKAG